MPSIMVAGRIPLGIYPFTVYFAACGAGLHKKALKKAGCPQAFFDSGIYAPFNAQKGRFTISYGTNTCTVEINADLPLIDALATISHECAHAASFILRHLDTPLCDATEEAYAYLSTYIFETITAKYLQKNGIIN